MKKLHRLCMAGVFTLVLTTATFAGDIETPGKTEPPPPPPDGLTAITPVEIQTGPGIQTSEAITDSVSEFGLYLLQIMLGVF